MSQTPEKQYGNTASGELEKDIDDLLERFFIEPYGQQEFVTSQETKLWMRFEDRQLQCLSADISDELNPYRTLIHIISSEGGFRAIEVLIPRHPSVRPEDDGPSPLQIIHTELLDYIQYDHLGGVIDAVTELYDGDIYDPVLQRVVEAASCIENTRPSPTKWQQRFNKAKRSASFVMTSLNEASPNPAWIALAASTITSQ